MSDSKTRQEMADILNVCLLAGRLLLENGANTALVERTVSGLGSALGADRMDVFVTPGAILVSAAGGGDHRTRLQRVTDSGVRLARLARLLALPGQADALSATEVRAELEAIENAPHHYGPGLTAVAVGLGCAAFGVNLGGTARDFVIVAAVAALAQLLRHGLGRFRAGKVLSTFLVAALASAAGMSLGGDLCAAASILLLVPGAALVSSTADLFRGDVLAGMTRAIGAMVTILVASAGVWAVVLAGAGDGQASFPGQPHPLVAACMGALAAAGFAVLFDVPGRYLGRAALVGFVALLMRSLIPHYEVAHVCAGLSIGFLAERLTRHATPATVLTMPGYIPLVPGAVFFAGILHMAAGRYVEGLASLVRAQIIVVAVALGMGVVPALAEALRKNRV